MEKSFEMARLKDKYRDEVVSSLMEEFGYKNAMAVPRIAKVTVNMGVGQAVANPKPLEMASNELSVITGQRPVITRAKKSIAGFKLRKGMSIGCKVTLRGDRMYEFLDRLFNIALPRIRDFMGTSPSSFDGRGNYTLGIKEQIIFPEIDYDKVQRISGMDITIVTTAGRDEPARLLLKLMGMPFRE